MKTVFSFILLLVTLSACQTDTTQFTIIDLNCGQENLLFHYGDEDQAFDYLVVDGSETVTSREEFSQRRSVEDYRMPWDNFEANGNSFISREGGTVIAEYDGEILAYSTPWVGVQEGEYIIVYYNQTPCYRILDATWVAFPLG